MDLAFRLRELLADRRMSQADLAKLADLPEETVSRLVNGVTKNPRLETLRRLMAPLNVPVGWLLGEKGFEISPAQRAQMRALMTLMHDLLAATEPANRTRQPSNVTPVYLGVNAPRSRRHAPVEATNWRESFGDRREEDEVEIPRQFEDLRATLVFRAEGESMTAAHILPGDLLFVREESRPARARGEVVVCVVDGSLYVKRLELADRKIRLVSATDGFDPMVFDEEHVLWSLIGIVVGWLHAR